MKILSRFITILMITLTVNSQTRILLDENFSEWTSGPQYTDSAGDQISGNLDLRRLWISNDNNYLFLSFETGGEVILQQENNLTLYLDADNNSSTGLSTGGIGAEIKYDFGNKSGIYYSGNSTTDIKHIHLGLLASPTVSSERFEVALSRNSSINGSPLFSGLSNTVKLILRDEGAGKDQLPNETGGVSYSFVSNNSSLPNYSIPKLNDNHLRVVSYNVEQDALFEGSKQGYFERIIKAIKPDVFAFQEIYTNGAAEAKNKIVQFLSGSWYSEKADYDRILVSKYPILSFGIIETLDYYPSDYYLIDTQNKYGTNVLIVVSHPKCCSGSDNDEKRQNQVDAIMSFVRKVKAGTGPVSITSNTPIIIAGDMNFVGNDQQQITLLTGDIQNNAGYGPDFAPDWDNTPLDDSKPYTTGVPATFTNYDPSGNYIPGRLDYIVFTGSVMSCENSFALFTGGMSASDLSQYGLSSGDSENASDHIPVVADFELGKVNDLKQTGSLPENFRLDQNYPNPFNPTTRFNYYLAERSNVNIKITDTLGRIVYEKDLGKQSPGEYTQTFDAGEAGISSGIYFLNVDFESNRNIYSSTKKIVLLK